MAKLIAVIGNVGVGKTTFARQLCAAAGYTLALEQHSQRPFHDAFAASDHDSALPNQIDYLLLRAEQERHIRLGTPVGVLDGGLEQDFFVFTRYFYQIKRLSEAEYDLCQRLYQFIRQSLPPPDLIISLQAPLHVLVKRYQARHRAIEVIRTGDIQALDLVVRECVGGLQYIPIIQVDASTDDPKFVSAIKQLQQPIMRILNS